MNKKKMLIITVFLVVVISLMLTVHWYVRFREVSEASWLKLGVYMTYEQFFVWDEHSDTEYMTWNITKLWNGVVDLSLTSHSVNVTNGNVELTVKEANLTIEVVTREVVSGSEIIVYYLDEKWPFWIETNVTIGSTIDIWYGVNTITKNESIYVLGQQRNCWMVEYSWTTANMKRWYDKSSGICLKIHVILYRQDVIIQITETAVLTNIDL